MTFEKLDFSEEEFAVIISQTFIFSAPTKSESTKIPNKTIRETITVIKNFLFALNNS